MNEDRRSLAPAPGGDTNGDNLSMELKPEDIMKAVERFPSFVLEPHQLLFTDTAVGELVSISIIWFSRDANVPRPSYRPSSLRLISRVFWSRGVGMGRNISVQNEVSRGASSW